MELAQGGLGHPFYTTEVPLDEHEFEIAFDIEEPASRRFHKEDLAVLGLDLLAGIAGAVTGTLNQARNLAAWHANYKFDQDAFHQEAALEIETLTSGEDSDG